MLGFGSIGQGVLPLILRHIRDAAERVQIITADERGSARRSPADARRIAHSVMPVTRENYRASAGLVARAWRFPAEPVSGRRFGRIGLTLPRTRRALPRYLRRALGRRLHGIRRLQRFAARSNYALREKAQLALARPDTGDPTAVMTPRRQSGSGVSFREAGSAEHRRRHRDRDFPYLLRVRNGLNWRGHSASR